MADRHIAFSRAKPLIIPYVFDGGGASLEGNPSGFLPISFDGYIQSAVLVADEAPTLFRVRIDKCAREDYPSGLASIVGSTPPTLEGVEQMEDEALEGWTKEFNTDSVFRFVVLDTDTLTVATIALNVIRY